MKEIFSRPFLTVIFLTASLLSLTSAFAQTDTFNITTYYPAPAGVYLRLTTQTLGVGDTNADDNMDGADSPDPGIAAQQGDLWIAGNVGIGTTNPQNTLDVAGNTVIGAGYAGVNTAPANGLLVEGDVGIGTTSPQANLEVNNTLRLTPTDAPLHTVRGAIYYDDSENMLKYYDAANWRNMGGLALGQQSINTVNVKPCPSSNPCSSLGEELGCTTYVGANPKCPPGYVATGLSLQTGVACNGDECGVLWMALQNLTIVCNELQ